eukprot:7799354-Karenia_brevis.AAC.1
MNYTDAGIKRMISPREIHVANALLQARMQPISRLLQYDLLKSTSAYEPAGINRRVYNSMGEIGAMQGRHYHFRILAVCYGVMQMVPRAECSNWATSVRDYLRRHYPA